MDEAVTADLIEKRRRDTIFLLQSNCRSEDVLDYPCELLIDAGMQVERIVGMEDDLGPDKTLSLLNRKVGTQLRVISCAHALMSSKTMAPRLMGVNWLEDRVPEFYSLADTLRILKPHAFYYISHDLSEPFLKADMPFLPMADCVFVATEQTAERIRGYNSKVRVVGWPRFNERLIALTEKTAFGSVWFVSSFLAVLGRMPPGAFAEHVRALIEAGIAFKLPAYMNTTPYEDAIRENGGTCIEASVTSLDVLAQTEMPVITAGSGLELEAELLGKPYIRFHYPIAAFGMLPGNPSAECRDFDALIRALSSVRPIHAAQPPALFDEHVFLSEVLRDVGTPGQRVETARAA
jgi:hypothetical protein